MKAANCGLDSFGELNAIISTVDDDSIKSRIFTIRGVQVMLDCDLVELYGVQTKVLNQAAKRNIERYPERFMFQLSKEDVIIDRSTLIHVGASLTHIGKRCFAFSSMDKSNIPDILAKLSKQV